MRQWKDKRSCKSLALCKVLSIARKDWVWVRSLKWGFCEKWGEEESACRGYDTNSRRNIPTSEFWDDIRIRNHKHIHSRKSTLNEMFLQLSVLSISLLCLRYRQTYPTRCEHAHTLRHTHAYSQKSIHPLSFMIRDKINLIATLIFSLPLSPKSSVDLLLKTLFQKPDSQEGKYSSSIKWIFVSYFESKVK